MDNAQNAITGKEKDTVADLPRAALILFYRAFNNQLLDDMNENWSHQEDVTMSNPLGGLKKGWQEINGVYDNIFNGPADVYVEFYDYKIYESGDMFVAAGRERGNFQLAATNIALAIRTTRVYRQENGHWRQVHHHGSIDNPELLNKYQGAIHNQHQLKLPA